MPRASSVVGLFFYYCGRGKQEETIPTTVYTLGLATTTIDPAHHFVGVSIHAWSLEERPSSVPLDDIDQRDWHTPWRWQRKRDSIVTQLNTVVAARRATQTAK